MLDRAVGAALPSINKGVSEKLHQPLLALLNQLEDLDVMNFRVATVLFIDRFVFDRLSTGGDKSRHANEPVDGPRPKDLLWREFEVVETASMPALRSKPIQTM